MDDINKGISVTKLLKQLMDHIKQNVEEEFKEMKVTGSQGMLLGTLARHGSMKISELSQQMGLSSSTISGIVDRLEKQGLVERSRSEEDRRHVYVSVTSGFKKSAKKYFSAVESNIDIILNQATPEEIDKVYEGLDILRRLMDQQKNK